MPHIPGPLTGGGVSPLRWAKKMCPAGMLLSPVHLAHHLGPAVVEDAIEPPRLGFALAAHLFLQLLRGFFEDERGFKAGGRRAAGGAPPRGSPLSAASGHRSYHIARKTCVYNKRICWIVADHPLTRLGAGHERGHRVGEVVVGVFGDIQHELVEIGAVAVADLRRLHPLSYLVTVLCYVLDAFFCDI